ncbi:Two component Transcriptional regulator, Winged helix family [Thiobacillus denitrificans ATCC 25259]|uniref:Two component Transcriptional regulator, Winged helix family n=2 Tax=Thiobacillus denitrificans TaxID=36861 RepID=Q3SJC4_THIDA|nr:Two component Transcriptional regulator, Winged helix family [Thiobacillus denitrificans ATCC 25259]
MESKRILVVDDDQELLDMVCRYLGENGLDAHAAADSVHMDAWLASSRPDLIVLDVMLPGEDGLSVVKRLKSRLDVPVLMLSARSSDVDRILGLEMGADDYLTKPFHPRELLARIHARLRRSPAPRQEDALEAGSFRLDFVRRDAYKHGQPLALSTADFSLLSLLMRHSHRVLDRTQLVDLASAMERMPFNRSIDVRVARLRRKIEDDPAQPRYIRTVRGSGYLFVPDGGDER